MPGVTAEGNAPDEAPVPASAASGHGDGAPPSASPSGAPSRPGSLVDGYRPADGMPDEMLGPDGTARPHWQPFVESFSGLSSGELRSRRAKADRLLQENGAIYSAAAAAHHTAGKADQPGAEGSWPGADRPRTLDTLPLPIAPEEWRKLERGLIQRARLFNTILRDLHGPQTLIEDGSIPAALILGNPGFLRPCHGVPVPGNTWLHLYAVDLGRGADGRWQVLKDHAEIATGSGYALENRIVLSQSMPDMFRAAHVHRLASFFQGLHGGLAALTRRDDPRIVLLSGGPRSPAYFAHAYLARYLGYTLAEGADLTVRDGRVMLKTLDGLKSVDALLRRVPSADCDPLELFGGPVADSGAAIPGVAGLVRAARRGSLVIANALGSGLVGTQALAPYLGDLCRRVLGETLEIGDAPALWLGDPDQRAEALARRDELAFMPAFGPTEIDDLPRGPAFEGQMERDGAAWVARPAPHLSTAPILTDDGMEPRATVVRMFVAAAGADYVAMPGGIARMTPLDISGDGATQADAAMAVWRNVGTDDPETPVKDVWVLSDEPVPTYTLLPARLRGVHLRRTGKDLPSRAADNLFWLGRYAERTEDVMRVLRGILSRLSGDGAPETAPEVLARVLPGEPLDTPGALAPSFRALEARVAALIRDPMEPYGLNQTIDSLIRAAGRVRDRLSVEAWRTLSHLRAAPPFGFGDAAKARTAVARRSEIADGGDLLERLDDGIRTLAAFGGMEMENMTRSHSWRFLDMGRRIERGVHMVELLKALAAQGRPAEDGSLGLLLELADSFMTYRARYMTTPMLAPVLDLLLLDETNPRSVAFQVAALEAHAEALPRDRDAPRLSVDQRLILAMLADLRLIDMAELAPIPELPGRAVSADHAALSDLLDGLGDGLPQLSDALTRAYFTHARAPRRAGPSRGSTVPDSGAPTGAEEPVERVPEIVAAEAAAHAAGEPPSDTDVESPNPSAASFAGGGSPSVGAAPDASPGDGGSDGDSPDGEMA